MNVNLLSPMHVRNESGSKAGYDKTGGIKTEEELIAKLKQMHSDYRQKELAERKESAEAALPEEIEYEYKQYQGESEDEIKNRVTSEYTGKLESEKQLVSADTKAKTDELAKKAETAYYDYDKTESEILASLEKNKKANENKIIESGLSRSSIKNLIGESARQQADMMIAEAKADADNVAKKYQIQIDGLNEELQAAIDDLNAEYVIKISTEIEDLISKRDKEIKSIQEYNNKIDKQLADYKLEREKAIQEDVKRQTEADLQQAENERKYGYTGEKADNYAERLNIAVAFYDGFDPATAKEMVLNNHYLQTYLGFEYSNLLARYVKLAKDSK